MFGQPEVIRHEPGDRSRVIRKPRGGGVFDDGRDVPGDAGEGFLINP